MERYVVSRTRTFLCLVSYSDGVKFGKLSKDNVKSILDLRSRTI